MLDLPKMNKLAEGARSVERDPVKTQFTGGERKIAEHFFRSTGRDPDSKRMKSRFDLCKLLGKTLGASKWPLLENAAKGRVSLRSLVGGDPVKDKPKNDWQLKCLGLAEVRSGVFVVGLNQVFYSNVTMKDLLPPDS